MRKIILLLCLALLFSCKSKKPTATTPVVKAPEKPSNIVKPEDVEDIKKDRAYDIGKRLLESCNTSRFKPFTATEATDKVRSNATKTKISSICKKINQRNGRFLGIKLIDIARNKKTKELVFRYSIDYEKKLYKRELSVTVNEENKVSAIATKEIPAKPL
jgi:PBP1b-binding outer membrane lipoprotein LpoB